MSNLKNKENKGDGKRGSTEKGGQVFIFSVLSKIAGNAKNKDLTPNKT